MAILIPILSIAVAISIFQINSYLFKILKELREIKATLVVSEDTPKVEEIE